MQCYDGKTLGRRAPMYARNKVAFSNTYNSSPSTPPSKVAVPWGRPSPQALAAMATRRAAPASHTPTHQHHARSAVAAAELDSSRCWPPNRRTLGGTPPSRTPPASGVRGDMPTKGALTGLHGGYSEPGAGAARSAGATQMTCARGALGLAAEQCWQRTWSDLKNTKSEF